MLELNDDRQTFDPDIELETPFASLGFKKYTRNGRYGHDPNYILTTKLLKEVIDNNIFDPTMQYDELVKL